MTLKKWKKCKYMTSVLLSVFCNVCSSNIRRRYSGKLLLYILRILHTWTAVISHTKIPHWLGWTPLYHSYTLQLTRHTICLIRKTNVRLCLQTTLLPVSTSFSCANSSKILKHELEITRWSILSIIIRFEINCFCLRKVKYWSNV